MLLLLAMLKVVVMSGACLRLCLSEISASGDALVVLVCL